MIGWRREGPQPEERGQAKHIEERARELHREQSRDEDIAQDLRSQALRLDGRTQHGEEPADLDDQQQARLGDELDRERELRPRRERENDRREDDTPLLPGHGVQGGRGLHGRNHRAQGHRRDDRARAPARQVGPLPVARAETHPRELDNDAERHHQQQAWIEEERDGVRERRDQELDHSLAAARSGSG